MSSPRTDLDRRLRALSILILAILALQIVAVAHEVAGGRETLWPFLPWGMFRQAARPPVEALRHRIYAKTDDGLRRVRAEDSGFDRFAFRYLYRIPIAEGDSAAARDLARRVTRRWEVPVREIVVEETMFTLNGSDLRATTSVRRLETGSP